MKKAKKTIAGMESLFEIRQYDMKNSCFKLQRGSVHGSGSSNLYRFSIHSRSGSGV